MDLPADQSTPTSAPPIHPTLRAAVRSPQRRRPTGAAPPLPYRLQTSGIGWLVAAVMLVGLTLAVFARGLRGMAVVVTEVDDAVVGWLTGLQGPGLEALRGLAQVGSWWVLFTLSLGLLLGLLVLRRWRHLIVWWVAWQLVIIVTMGLATNARRPRPFGVDIQVSWGGWALPSVPVTFFAALLVGILYTLVPEGRGHHPLASVAPAALGHQRVQDPHQQGRKEGDRHRRQRPAAPAALDIHPERTWPSSVRRQAHRHDDHELPGDPPHDQVPPAAQDQQPQQQPQRQREQHPPGADLRQAPQRLQPRPLQAGQPAHHRVVDLGDHNGHPAQAAGEYGQGQPDQHHGGYQPANAAGLQPIRQRRGRASWPPPLWRPHSRSEGGVDRRGAGWCRLVCGQVHGPSQPGQLSQHEDLPCWLLACQGSRGAARSVLAGRCSRWRATQRAAPARGGGGPRDTNAQLAANSVTAGAICSARSSTTRCPAPGKRCSLASGMPSASARACSGLTERSLVPHTTSVGRVTWPSRSRKSNRNTALGASMVVCRGATAMMRRANSTRSRSGSEPNSVRVNQVPSRRRRSTWCTSPESTIGASSRFCRLSPSPCGAVEISTCPARRASAGAVTARASAPIPPVDCATTTPPRTSKWSSTAARS